MVVLLALLGALVVGLLVGLAWRGFIMIGDQRQLGVLTEQLNTEHRMNLATNQALARMRELAAEQFRQDRSV